MNRQLEEIRMDTANQLEQQRQEIAQKLAEMQAKAKEELEKYRLEWEKKNEEIRKNTEKNIQDIHSRFNDLVGKSTSYGVALMENFMDGIDSQMPALISKLESIAAMIDSYMPHSPAKRGPLKRIGEWGPAIIKELTEGIKRNLPNLENLTSRMALLSPGALRPAVANSYSTSYATTYNQGHNTIVFNVTGGWEQIERELAKRGVRF
jgi:vacuolar-type H+-ATPase subunit H